MTTIYALTDYKGNFESKYNAVPYNSGMDKDLLKKYFSGFGFEIMFVKFSDVINYPNAFWPDKIVIYTSSEDTGYYYKSFIEDIIFHLELSRAKVIPSYKYLRANNNKVFMELVRHQFNSEAIDLPTTIYGSYEEIKKIRSELNFPLVYKRAAGAMSRGVGIIINQVNLARKIKKISKTPNLLREFWEYGRSLKYKGYIRESRHRKKFLVQQYIEGLNGDFKVLIFGDKYYVLKRGTRKGDFRASGSGIRVFSREIPEGILEYANLCINILDVPNASLDIGYNGKSFFLIEFQCLYFGSFTLTYSDFYWLRTKHNKFELVEGKSVLEEEYARSIVNRCIQDESTFCM